MRRWSDEHVERLMGALLRTGVLAAAGVVLVGGILYLVQDGGTTPAYTVFVGEPVYLRSLSGIARDAVALDPRGIIQFGLLLLIATPVARVAFALLAFALQRDLVYVVITVIVLGILAYSLASSGL